MSIDLFITFSRLLFKIQMVIIFIDWNFALSLNLTFFQNDLIGGKTEYARN